MESFTSPAGCTMAGQQRAQDYLAAHPQYRLRSFRCEVDVPRQEHA
jgi:hypothetical protein